MLGDLAKTVTIFLVCAEFHLFFFGISNDLNADRTSKEYMKKSGTLYILIELSTFKMMEVQLKLNDQMVYTNLKISLSG